jgi:hypothetical protein
LGSEVENMKRLLILIGAICYCVAPDLFAGPIDDAIVLLGSMGVSSMIEKAKENRDPEYIRMDRDF